MIVKTGSKDLKFRIQGREVSFDKGVSVRMDHNVQSKLNDGTLVEAKKKAVSRAAPAAESTTDDEKKSKNK